ncbi:Type II toxin-antitoxin system RelE/ParE family toxin [Caenorhabditis elegans]|uniref:Type II toxin-antitoxin system RelE/ParE family toxin n=1 Tax=Caenorhabditis elegans TaxID=6239 RepID=Q3V5K3_CAEEL|nr:Type II toxin-antitoxin system RelE/ParE family toxin [Caenorhabditis elegans]CCD68967.1 Type II toxin-antitoxin system RelE/ParE family toxin [Caenorhabditis elegans]|eukprot:NP_001033573.1 Uncharacterized protein CELE_Y75D11A.6 [Caenorhabditis elegans]
MSNWGGNRAQIEYAAMDSIILYDVEVEYERIMNARRRRF